MVKVGKHERQPSALGLVQVRQETWHFTHLLSLQGVERKAQPIAQLSQPVFRSKNGRHQVHGDVLNASNQHYRQLDKQLPLTTTKLLTVKGEVDEMVMFLALTLVFSLLMDTILKLYLVSLVMNVCFSSSPTVSARRSSMVVLMVVVPCQASMNLSKQPLMVSQGMVYTIILFTLCMVVLRSGRRRGLGMPLSGSGQAMAKSVSRQTQRPVRISIVAEGSQVRHTEALVQVRQRKSHKAHLVSVDCAQIGQVPPQQAVHGVLLKVETRPEHPTNVSMFFRVYFIWLEIVRVALRMRFVEDVGSWNWYACPHEVLKEDWYAVDRSKDCGGLLFIWTVARRRGVEVAEELISFRVGDRTFGRGKVEILGTNTVILKSTDWRLRAQGNERVRVKLFEVQPCKSGASGTVQTTQGKPVRSWGTVQRKYTPKRLMQLDPSQLGVQLICNPVESSLWEMHLFGTLHWMQLPRQQLEGVSFKDCRETRVKSKIRQSI